MPEPKKQLDPKALTVEDTARVLSSAARKRIDAAKILTDIEAGAPTNTDGTINLVHYAAWLVQQMARGTAHGN